MWPTLTIPLTKTVYLNEKPNSFSVNVSICLKVFHKNNTNTHKHTIPSIRSHHFVIFVCCVSIIIIVVKVINMTMGKKPNSARKKNHVIWWIRPCSAFRALYIESMFVFCTWRTCLHFDKTVYLVSMFVSWRLCHRTITKRDSKRHSQSNWSTPCMKSNSRYVHHALSESGGCSICVNLFMWAHSN